MKKMTLYSLSLISAFAATSAFATEAPTPPVGEKNQAEKKLNENDTNNDGFISRDEWRTKGDQVFGEIDTDKDGKLSKDERKSHHEKKRAEWKERREDRREKMGKMKEKMSERAADKAAPTESH